MAVIAIVWAVATRPAAEAGSGETAGIAAADTIASPLVPPFTRMPLDIEPVVIGGFGDPRPNGFHAGIDFSTGGVVGLPVHAPAAGWIARVRASGAGDGRSIELRVDDGQVLLFGHLDAFDEPVAAYVDSAQRASGRYEVDLEPDAGRFPVAAGQRIGWSGESGVGPARLHFEVRAGDVALHPLRAGVVLADREPPRIARIVLEPLDEHATVSGSAAPRAWSGRDGDTVVVAGRFRVRVLGSDVIGSGAGVSPWSTSVSFGGRAVECRFDTLPATETGEVDAIHAGEALRLAVPSAARPRPLRATGPWGRETPGAFEVLPGDPPRELVLAMRDVAGNHAERRVLVRPPRDRERRAPPVMPIDTRPPIRRMGVELAVDPLPRDRIRVTTVRSPESADAVWMERAGSTESVAASRDGAEWTAVLAFADPWQGRLRARGVFDARYWIAESEVRLALSARPGGDRARIGLYRWSGSRWEWIPSASDTAAGTWAAASRRLGRFALFEDARAPRVRRAAPVAAAAGPYSRWALEAEVEDGGSGIDAGASRIVVDGTPVPTEWDADRGVLRWRPLHRPSAGSFRCLVRAVDRAGNAAEALGSFVIN